MALPPLLELARAQFDMKHLRYTMASAVAVTCNLVILFTCSGLIGLGPVHSNIIAVSLSCIPSYLLNRYWVWGKRGRNHFWKEVAPFWALALLGLALSTG